MLPHQFLRVLNTIVATGTGPPADTAGLTPRINSIYQSALALSHVGNDVSTAAANALLDQFRAAAAPLLPGSDDGEGSAVNEAKWERFVLILFDDVFKVLGDMIQLAKDHPDYAFAAVVAIAAPHLCAGVVVPILEYIGFTSTGILAGSVPAAVQALIGNITPHSLFAILQSASMHGYGGAVINMFIRTHALDYLVARGLYDSWAWLEGR